MVGTMSWYLLVAYLVAAFAGGCAIRIALEYVYRKYSDRTPK